MILQNHDHRKCEFCNNFMVELGTCKFCSFEYDKEYNPYAKDNWDILKMDPEDGWEHIQILDRLRYKGIECYAADIWYDNNVALLIGCRDSESEIARALGIYEDCLYTDPLRDMIIINLFKERYLRGELE